MPPRFLTLADVTEILNISAAQAYALVRSGELPAIQIGGRLQWRVEATELEAYIQRMYAQTRARLDAERVDGSGVPRSTADDAPQHEGVAGSDAPGADGLGAAAGLGRDVTGARAEGTAGA